MKKAMLITGFISVIIFASIFLEPPADPQSAPKAWAHGVTFVLPRIAGTLIFALLSATLTGIQMFRSKTRKALRDPATVISLLLLLPAAFTLAVMIRIVTAIAVDMNR